MGVTINPLYGPVNGVAMPLLPAERFYIPLPLDITPLISVVNYCNRFDTFIATVKFLPAALQLLLQTVSC